MGVFTSLSRPEDSLISSRSWSFTNRGLIRRFNRSLTYNYLKTLVLTDTELELVKRTFVNLFKGICIAWSQKTNLTYKIGKGHLDSIQVAVNLIL